MPSRLGLAPKLPSRPSVLGRRSETLLAKNGLWRQQDSPTMDVRKSTFQELIAEGPGAIEALMLGGPIVES